MNGIDILVLRGPEPGDTPVARRVMHTTCGWTVRIAADQPIPKHVCPKEATQ